MKHKLPTSVRLLGRKVTIKYLSTMPGDADDPTFGDNDPARGVIQVNLEAHDEGGVDIFTTLFHELCHLTLAWTGHAAAMTESQHEALVLALENVSTLLKFR